jgi:hypothetical protein
MMCKEDQVSVGVHMHDSTATREDADGGEMNKKSNALPSYTHVGCMYVQEAVGSHQSGSLITAASAHLAGIGNRSLPS